MIFRSRCSAQPDVFHIVQLFDWCVVLLDRRRGVAHAQPGQKPNLGQLRSTLWKLLNLQGGNEDRCPKHAEHVFQGKYFL